MTARILLEPLCLAHWIHFSFLFFSILSMPIFESVTTRLFSLLLHLLLLVHVKHRQKRRFAFKRETLTYWCKASKGWLTWLVYMHNPVTWQKRVKELDVSKFKRRRIWKHILLSTATENRDVPPGSDEILSLQILMLFK